MRKHCPPDCYANCDKAMLSQFSSFGLLASCFHCTSSSSLMTTKPVFQSDLKRSCMSSDSLERRLDQHPHVHTGEHLKRQWKERFLLLFLPPRKQHTTRAAGTPLCLTRPAVQEPAKQKRNAAMATQTRLLLEPVLYALSCPPTKTAKLSNNQFLLPL